MEPIRQCKNESVLRQFKAGPGRAGRPRWTRPKAGNVSAGRLAYVWWGRSSPASASSPTGWTTPTPTGLQNPLPSPGMAALLAPRMVTNGTPTVRGTSTT